MERKHRQKLEEAAQTLRAAREDVFRVSRDVCEDLALERAEQLIREVLGGERATERRAA